MCRIAPEHFEMIKLDSTLGKLARPRRRITEFMASLAKQQSYSSSQKRKIVEFVFLKTPIEIMGSSQEKGAPLNGVKFVSNKYNADFSDPNLKLDTEEVLNALPVIEDPTKSAEIIPSDLVIRSIGYKNVSIDNDIPFDKKAGVVPNKQGRVLDAKGKTFSFLIYILIELDKEILSLKRFKLKRFALLHWMDQTWSSRSYCRYDK